MEKKQSQFAKGALGHSLTSDLVAIVHFMLEYPAVSSWEACLLWLCWFLGQF